MNNEESFFDIHCHAMNLSHPNLTAFLQRVNINLFLSSAGIWGPFVEIFQKKKIERIKNLLSVMENDTANFFLLMEYYLRTKGLVENNTFEVEGRSYKKIVLTPLMMDFGSKHTHSGTFYNIPPQKPIVEQVVDVFNGIAKYSKYEMVVGDNKVSLKEVKKEDKLFEIYPFLGINTQNYDIQRITDMLDKYFSKYNGNRLEFYDTMGRFTGNIENLGNNVFAGIKVYPPLGFDPWPDDYKQRERVEAIYERCYKKNIPITTHCNDGGFRTETKSNAKDFTNPSRWDAVLKKYPTLKLNFAHFGKQKKTLCFIPQKKWEGTILELMANYKNVYADFSYNGCEKEEYYKYLQKLLEKNPDVKERILFGSDFMINLTGIDSYNDYLESFATSQSISMDDKHIFCSINPSRFLFG
ncbi:amidohydrolase [bacterium]|nr:amidohydrolase [bacterium]MBU1754414.1 amidohydrolase [bacterium]